MIKNYLFVFPTAILGGAERVMFNTIYYLLEKNNSVTVLIMSRGQQKGWDDIKNHKNMRFLVKDFKSEKKSILNVTSTLIFLDRKNKYDVVFSSHTHVNGLLSLMKKMGFFEGSYLISRESTFIFERFTGIKRNIFYKIYKHMYGSQDLIICQTDKMKESLIKNLGFMPAKKVETIYNPVNIDFIRSKIGLCKKKKYIVACGRFIKIKQFDILVKAFAKIHEKYPEYNLVIIGDGVERNNIESLIKDLNLSDKIILTGKIDSPFEWFCQAEVGIVTSVVEGFPNVLLEMMTCGVSNVITTPCTDGLNKIPNIYVSKNCSEESITEELFEVLSNNNDFSNQYISYIESYRSISHFWHKVESFL